MSKVSCREMFTTTLLELAKRDTDIVALTSDARGSVSLGNYVKELPEQFIEIGIAEQNEVGIAAGLATCGKKPFVCAPACFLSARSLEQIKVDVAYSNTNVKIIGVSGGVSYGALGSSHHSLQDIAVMRAIPGMTVILPSDIHQTRIMTQKLAEFKGPVYVRMGRGAVPDVYSEDNSPFEIGKANVILEGKDIAIIATGETVKHALDAGIILKQKGISARVIDMHTLKPFDEAAVIRAAEETGCLVTVEEHSIYGGLGAAVAQTVVGNCPVPVRIIGIPDEPVVSGNSAEIFRYYGLDAESIAGSAERMLNQLNQK